MVNWRREVVLCSNDFVKPFKILIFFIYHIIVDKYLFKATRENYNRSHKFINKIWHAELSNSSENIQYDSKNNFFDQRKQKQMFHEKSSVGFLTYSHKRIMLTNKKQFR